jgi:hypothetical protein
MTVKIITNTDKVTTTGMDMNAVTDMGTDMDNGHGHHQNFANVVFTSFLLVYFQKLYRKSWRKLAEVLAIVIKR